MIVCRKPFTAYDVDLIGAAAIGALLLAAGWLVVVPWQETWDRYRELVAQRRAAQVALQRDTEELARFEVGLAPLQGIVTAEAERVPPASGLSDLLREMTEIAKESNLELLTVTPQPVVHSGAYLVSDIHVGGRGRSRDFIRFLDRLAQKNPYQALQTCWIGRPARETEPICDFAWTTRLYLLPSDSGRDNGGGV